MGEIFLSHAVADQKLAKLLTNFLKEAIGVPQDAIFCSSIPGHGIPMGDDFNGYIKDQIQNPKLVILLMTPAYMESWFCLMELGAAWAKSHRTIAVVVPPVSFSSVTATLGSKQAWDITKKKGLVDFRGLVRDCVTSLEKRTEHIWDEKRDQWNVDLKKVLGELTRAMKVDASTHAEVIDELEEARAEIGDLERAKVKLEAKIEQLKALKDAEEVNALAVSEPGLVGARAQFDRLIEAVEDARPARASTVVFHHILMDYFEKASPINFYSSDADEFRTAMQYAIIDADTQEVAWSRGKLGKLRTAIRAVVEFMESYDGRQLSKSDPDGAWDPDDLQFWEDRL